MASRGLLRRATKELHSLRSKMSYNDRNTCRAVFGVLIEPPTLFEALNLPPSTVVGTATGAQPAFHLLPASEQTTAQRRKLLKQTCSIVRQWDKVVSTAGSISEPERLQVAFWLLRQMSSFGKEEVTIEIQQFRLPDKEEGEKKNKGEETASADEAKEEVKKKSAADDDGKVVGAVIIPPGMHEASMPRGLFIPDPPIFLPGHVSDEEEAVPIVPFLHHFEKLAAGGKSAAGASSTAKDLPSESLATSVDGVFEVRARTTRLGRDSETSKHSFSYEVTVKHTGKTTSGQEDKSKYILLSRTWCFIGQEQREAHVVVGYGVVGQTPLLGPGDEHTWQSGTSLNSEHGYLHGSLSFWKMPCDDIGGIATLNAERVDFDVVEQNDKIGIRKALTGATSVRIGTTKLGTA